MGALMLLQAAKAFSVAANTAVNLLDLPGGHFVRPFRVSQQLAAHGSTGDASACKLLLYKIRLIQSAHAGDGLVRVLANLIAEFQEAALLFEVRVVGRGNGVLQTGMVRQRNMEAGHTGISQQRYKNTQLGLHHTGIAVVGIFLADGQLVVDGNLRQTAADSFDGLHRKAGTVRRCRRIHPCGG